MTAREAAISVVPANQASCEELQTIFGAVGFARERGARAIEGYPITTKNLILEELHAGTGGVFAAAGFAEVSRPTPRDAS